MALDTLIRGQFPRDKLHIIGFSLYAREITADQLPALGRVSARHEHAERLHARPPTAGEAEGRKQADHHDHRRRADGALEGSQANFKYPPTSRTIQETLKEVKRCTRDDITINTFMLEQSDCSPTSSTR